MHRRVIESGKRSELQYCETTDTLQRVYHDTGEVSKKWVPRRDGKGVARGRQNIRLRLEEDAVFRGSPTSSLPPPHLVRVLVDLMAENGGIDSLASKCGVRTSTAWGYVYAAVERWPSEACAPAARRFLSPALLAVLREVSADDVRGSLRAVLERLEAKWPALRADPGWVVAGPERYAQLRLARLIASQH